LRRGKMSGTTQVSNDKAKIGFVGKVFGIFTGSSSIKVGGPTGIPAFIGRAMVPELHKLPVPTNWVRYMMVVRPQAGKSDTYDIRVIDEFEINNKTRKLTVHNYAFLDSYPDLVKFEGWFNSKTHEVRIEVKVPAEGPKETATP
jgi:hypothetical protein